MRETVAKDVLRAFLGTLVAVARLFRGRRRRRPPCSSSSTPFPSSSSISRSAGARSSAPCSGTMCGLVQDTFSLGVFGVAGLTKTLLGFWTGYISRQDRRRPVRPQRLVHAGHVRPRDGRSGSSSRRSSGWSP